MSSLNPITIEWTLNRGSGARTKPVAPDAACQEQIPRPARLMALAIKFDILIRQGVVRDYADLARLGHVSRARITQIMNLLHLAPDIQEQLLNLRTSNGTAQGLCERHLRKLAGTIDWSEQRQLCRSMFSTQASWGQCS